MPGLHDRLWRAQRGVCPVCNLLLSVPVHIDHKIPLARGGTHAEENLQLLHARCNLRKGSR